MTSACRWPARRRRPRCCGTAASGCARTRHADHPSWKLPLGLVEQWPGGLSSSVENKMAVPEPAARYGLAVPSCEILTFGARQVLSVEQFDRRLHSSGRWWLRLPREDFCQALGLPPHLK